MTGGFVGLDLSLVSSGLAYCDGSCALIGVDKVTTMSIVQQFTVLDQLTHRILDWVQQWQPQLVLVEQLDMSRSYGGTIERTVLWWQVVKALHLASIPVMTAASAQGKIYATGTARASKEQVVDAVARRWPGFDTRGNNNLADAAVYCAMASAWSGQPLTELPVTHTRALTKIKSIGIER